jgi:tape measure domain-containing protein
MAAQDAELQLKVSLDLAFFKQQLAGLGTSAAGYRLPINIKFDRLSVQKELNTLGDNIKKRTYRLNVETNIAAEIKNAGTLAKALRGLDNASQKNRGIANRAATSGEAGAITGTVDAAKFQAMLNRATKPALTALYEQMSKLKIPMADVGKGTTNELRKSIMSGVPAITRDIAEGLANGLDPKLKESGRKGAKLFIDEYKDASGIASPSKVFKQLGEFSADGLEIGFINGLKDFKTKAIAEIKKIAALMKLELASVGDVNIGAGIGFARGGVRGGTQYMSPIGPLSLGSREPWARGSRGMYGGSGFEPFMGGPTRGAQGVLSGIPGIASAISTSGMLGQSRLALPAAGESSAAYMRSVQFAAREQQARLRSAARGASVMGENQMYATVAGQVPVGAGGPFLPAGRGGGGGGMQPPGGGGGGGGGFGGFGRALGSVPNLPGVGTIRELGGEFAFAAKQVVLFGQAYKLLAFIQDFPAQVGAAVGQLQNFRNTLGSITPTTEEARASNELILDLMNRYNVPLQSARDGFTKLYASMAPAGFSGDEIRELFTGITKAAATFGMSADKVDRVNYAFAQMASKGQIMSEELKGQLGDVLPGAMALFAEAAGFEGPKAIQDFSAALEDGAYKGEAMVALLKNVGIVMNQEFGPGAEGAARTFQGVINRMQNSMTLLYESFEPVAVGFLNNVVAPMTNGIKQLSDGLNAFFTGTAAKTAGGFAIAEELERLRPTFDGIGQNVQKLVPVFQQFANTALGIAKILLEIASNPFIGYLARIYASVLPLTIAIQALNLQALIPMIANFLRAIPAFVAYTAATVKGVTANKALQLSMQLTGSTAAKTAVQIRSVGVAIKAAFTGTIVLAAVAGIGMIIEKIISLNAQMADTRAKALGAAQAIRAMSQTEARQAAQQYEAGAQSLRALNEQVEQGKMKGKAWIEVTGQQAKALQDAGIIVSSVRGSLQVQPTRVSGAFQKLEGLAAEARHRERGVAFAERETQTSPVLSAIPEVAGEGKTKRERQLRDFESEAIAQLRLNQRLAQERLDQQRQLELIDETEYDIASASNKRKFELLIIEEALAGKRASIGDYEAGIRQKQLAVFEKLAANEGQLVEEEYKTAIKGAQLKISRPFKEGIKTENIEIEKQALLLRNLQAGYSELTPEQEANLIIEEKVKDLRVKQRELVKTEIENLRQVTLERVRGAQALAKEAELLKLRNQAAQLRAPLGRERLVELMQAPGYTPEQAKQQFSLEEQNKRLQAMRQGASDLAGTINSSIGDALTNIVTDFQNLQQHGMTFLQTLANGFKQLANTIIQEMTRAMISKAVSQLFSFAMPGIGNAGGGGGADLTAGIRQYAYANGGIAPGGFRAFASGGVVTGPTLGLVGEGRYNEAVVPLPDGKSIPVQLGGGAGGDISTNIVVNVSNGQASSQMSGNGGQALGRELEGAVKQVILKETRPGGLIYSAR